MWRLEDISFALVDDLTDDPVMTLLVSTPEGKLTFTAEPCVDGDILVLQGVHVQDPRPNAIGAGNLLLIAQALMEGMGFDGLVIEGAVRSTGANLGYRPRVVRITRRGRPSPFTGKRDTQDD